ncbi:hypothetical protein IFR05_010748 [Cadophora sp. M221]|nr:hypothetical protein IFR05_010748 [Cadophora sp. M221]
MALSGTLYPPLKDGEIRILIIHPSQRGDTIPCDLISCPLKTGSNMPYAALSYTWGSTNPSKNIRVNGYEVHIRQNLWLALGALRDETDRRTIRADAICINQSEILERNRQVSRMCDIYRSASCIAIWLGEACDDSDLVFDYLGTSQASRLLRIAMGSEGLPGEREDSPVCLSKRFKKALLALCERPYWRRVWIIQGVLAASRLTVLCGLRSVALTNVLLAQDTRLYGEISSESRSPLCATLAWSIICLRGTLAHQDGYSLSQLILTCSDCGS